MIAQIPHNDTCNGYLQYSTHNKSETKGAAGEVRVRRATSIGRSWSFWSIGDGGYEGIIEMGGGGGVGGSRRGRSTGKLQLRSLHDEDREEEESRGGRRAVGEGKRR